MIYTYIYVGFLFVLVKGIDHGLSPVVRAVLSEATRFVTADCT